MASTRLTLFLNCLTNTLVQGGWDSDVIHSMWSLHSVCTAVFLPWKSEQNGAMQLNWTCASHVIQRASAMLLPHFAASSENGFPRGCEVFHAIK